MLGHSKRTIRINATEVRLLQLNPGTKIREGRKYDLYRNRDIVVNYSGAGKILKVDCVAIVNRSNNSSTYWVGNTDGNMKEALYWFTTWELNLKEIPNN